MRKYKTYIFTGSSIIVFAVLLLSSCKENKVIGSAIPSGGNVISLDEVLENSSKYDGKKVVMKGVVGPKCCPSLCDIKFKSGKNTIKMFPKGFKLEKIDTGTPITAYVEVTSGEEQSIFAVLGMEVEEK